MSQTVSMMIILLVVIMQNILQQSNIITIVLLFQNPTDFLLIMSKTAMISMLESGSNGNDLLAILDSLTAQDEAVTITNQPTLENIEF